LTTKEAWRNLNEIANADDRTEEEWEHYWEVAEKLSDEKTKI